jgi:hypothetical protein
MADFIAIAERIREEHAGAVRGFKSGIVHAMACGDLLIEAKRALRDAEGHGNWLDPVRDNTDISERTAQLYMKLARRRPEIEANPQRVADMKIRDAAKGNLADAHHAEPEAAGPRRGSLCDDTPPDEFPQYKWPLATDHCCPNCWFSWNGDPLAGAEAKAAASTKARMMKLGLRIGRPEVEDEEDPGMRYGVVIEKAA